VDKQARARPIRIGLLGHAARKMRHLSAALFLAALGLGAASAGALAQQLNRFDIRLMGAVRYDSNVARSDAAFAALRGIEREDISYSPTLLLDILRNLGGLSLSLQGIAGYNFYQRNVRLNRERIDLRSALGSRVGPCDGKLLANYARSQLDLLDVTTNVVQNARSASSIGVEAICEGLAAVVPTFALTQTWNRNSAARFAISDFNTFSAQAGISYNRSTLGEFTIFGQYSDTLFPNRSLPIGGLRLNDGFRLYTGGLRYSRSIGSRIVWNLSPSFTSLVPYIPGMTGSQRITYETDISYRPITRLQLHAAFAKRIAPAYLLNATYSVNQVYSLDTNYKLGARWTIQVGASRLVRDFRGTMLVTGMDLTGDTIEAVFGSLGFELTRRLSFILDTRKERRKADIRQFNYDGYQVGLSASMAF
jgi:hypothetical protein